MSLYVFSLLLFIALVYIPHSMDILPLKDKLIKVLRVFEAKFDSHWAVPNQEW